MDAKSLLPILFAVLTLTAVGVGAICYLCRKYCRRRKSTYNEKYEKKKRKYTKDLNTGYPKLPLLEAAAKDIQIVQMLHRDQYSTRPVLIGESISEEGAAPDERRRKENGVSRAYNHRQKYYPTSAQRPISCTEMYYPQVESPPIHQMHLHSPLTQSSSAPQLPASPNNKTKKQSLSGRHERRTPVTGPLEAREKDEKRNKRSRSVVSPTLSHNKPNLARGKYRSEGNLSFFTSFDFSAQHTTISPMGVIYPAEGTLEYNVHYDTDNESTDVFTVTIHRLNDVAVNPTNYIGILEVVTDETQLKTKPYLKDDGNGIVELVHETKVGYLVYASLLPNSTFKRHTSVVLGTTNNAPTTVSFNESFVHTDYSVSDLNKMILCLHVLSRFGSEHDPVVIGEIRRPLTELAVGKPLQFCDKMREIETELEVEIPPRTPMNLGELLIVLSYDLMKHQIIVKIIEATSLPKFSVTGNPSVSVKTSLYFHNKRIAKQTSSIQRKQKHPTFNETFYFDLSKERVHACDLLFEVRHHGPVHRSVIGYIHVGASAEGSGASQWKQLLDFTHFEKVSHRIVPTKPVTLL